jgi:hypothetical protein
MSEVRWNDCARGFGLGLFDRFLFEKPPPSTAAVTKEIRRRAWPYLKSIGFSRFSPRTAWRSWQYGVDIVNFRSVSHIAGIPPTSFGLHLAVYYRASHPHDDARRYPPESDGDARRVVAKGLKQEVLPRPDVWWIERDASNARDGVEDALEQLRRVAPGWFEEFHDLGRAVDAFANREDSFMGPGIAEELIGGTLGSPSRVAVLRALDALRKAQD